MHSLLSTAEKNAEIAKYYDALANAEGTEGEELPQRIENVLYSLVNDYDDSELKVVQKIKYNEAVISARDDVAIAQANFDAMFAEQQKKKNLGDLLLSWAFADDSSQADVSVKRFDTVFPAAGTPSSAIELAPEELFMISRSAGWVDIAKL